MVRIYVVVARFCLWEKCIWSYNEDSTEPESSPTAGIRLRLGTSTLPGSSAMTDIISQVVLDSEIEADNQSVSSLSYIHCQAASSPRHTSRRSAPSPMVDSRLELQARREVIMVGVSMVVKMVEVGATAALKSPGLMVRISWYASDLLFAKFWLGCLPFQFLLRRATGFTDVGERRQNGWGWFEVLQCIPCYLGLLRHGVCFCTTLCSFP